jgi:hypothetical protein
MCDLSLRYTADILHADDEIFTVFTKSEWIQIGSVEKLFRYLKARTTVLRRK